MSALQDDVDALREQLAQQEAILELQKREAKEKEEQSWKYNIGVLEKNTTVMSRRVGATSASAVYPGLVPIVNCLQRLDESISHIENVITELDERLTHIERFLTDDIKKEEFLENKPQNNIVAAAPIDPPSPSADEAKNTTIWESISTPTFDKFGYYRVDEFGYYRDK